MARGRFALLACIAIIAASCGSDAPVCGNAVKEDGEECDDGNRDDNDYCTNNCVQQNPGTPDLTVHWAFNETEAENFDGDSCYDVEVRKVEVEVVGPETRTMTESCGLFQVVFLDLQPGTYQATVRPLGSEDVLMVKEPAVRAFTMTGQDHREDIYFAYEDWTTPYLGTFFFRLAWGGRDCDEADPPVVSHRLLLEQGGRALTGFVTDDGDPVDGSESGPCRSNKLVNEEFPQSVEDIPWGPTVFTIEGLDAHQETRFRSEIDTFVGAGPSNPDILFDVRSLAPDAGVPDAGIPDAGMPETADAGIPDAGI